MSDNAESVSARLQHLVLHDHIAPVDAVAPMEEDTLGQHEQQQRPEVFPANEVQAGAPQAGENANEIDVASAVQVDLPPEPPRCMVGVNYHKKKRKWEAILVTRLPPRVEDLARFKKKSREVWECVGIFDTAEQAKLTAEQAKRAYDNALLRLN